MHRYQPRRRQLQRLLHRVDGQVMGGSTPMVPLFENQALGVAIVSYAGGLFWGINSDWDVVPDLHDFTVGLREEFDVLHRLAGVGDPAERRSVAPGQ